MHVEKISSTEIKQGTLIDYKIKIHGVPTRWQAEISEWQPPFKFVDTQLRGPRDLWHHTHGVPPLCGGTLMVDRVRYRLPLEKSVRLAGTKLMRKEMESLFSSRRKFIANLEIPRHSIRAIVCCAFLLNKRTVAHRVQVKRFTVFSIKSFKGTLGSKSSRRLVNSFA